MVCFESISNIIDDRRCGSHSDTDDFCRMGELEPWIDENFVRNVWFQLGENVNVKMIRDKFSGYVD